LANTSFILEQLKQDVFADFKSRELLPSISENGISNFVKFLLTLSNLLLAQTVVRELESFIKIIYKALAGCLSQV
jgi:hypothetical protein